VRLKVIKVKEVGYNVDIDSYKVEALWFYEDETSELFLIEKPESFTHALAGLGEDMWKSVDGTDYIRHDRQTGES